MHAMADQSGEYVGIRWLRPKYQLRQVGESPTYLRISRRFLEKPTITVGQVVGSPDAAIAQLRSAVAADA